ncbi:hypothetical protein J8I26_21010 [Herbaspirillum sp. LeCh32-8]|uniref:hypothetical protein n=1 Tax=Herbaspirillum sp. LeCh32-8 TaxID=2821356 RepID=UPI001AE51857|nr:hypothetical protein [Herbaspirillum sp. LeCh32-8]MBP0600606.1 hypothetical protein [Herbaspirillum sp. LeCh32-8]
MDDRIGDNFLHRTKDQDIAAHAAPGQHARRRITMPGKALQVKRLPRGAASKPGRERPEERRTAFFLVQNSPVLLQILILIVDDLKERCRSIMTGRAPSASAGTGFSSRA